MPDFPTGTVTLLFTDIEGSTQLLKTLGESYERALSDHRALLRRAFNLFGGQIVDRQGDAFFVVFRRARDAVAAAVEAQRALISHPWPDGLELRVRMGIHTGEPTIGDEGLTGLAVHRAARICSTAKGGQVLISGTTGDLVEDELPSGVELHDLGEHALKDFDRPARLFQLGGEGLREAVPIPANAAAGPEPASAALDANEVRRPPDASAASGRLRTRITSPLRTRGGLGRIIPRPIRRRFGTDPIVIGSRIHSMSRLSPSPELATALRALGGAVIQAARSERDARRIMRSVDRRALRRRVDAVRSDPFLTKEEANLADVLAKQWQALDRLAELRPVLRTQIKRVGAQATELREEVFAIRMGRPLSGGLIEELSAQCASIRSLCAQVQEAERDARHFEPARTPWQELRGRRRVH
jgi:class 3 adenylate cyclase